MENNDKKIVNETINQEADSYKQELPKQPEQQPQAEGQASETPRQTLESMRVLVLNLLDTVQMMTVAIKQISINQNTIEHYIAEEVQKITMKEYAEKMGPLRKRVLEELMEQVKNNKTLAQAVKDDLAAEEAKSALPVKEAPKAKKSIFDEHSA